MSMHAQRVRAACAWLLFAGIQVALATKVFAHDLKGDEPEYLARGVAIGNGDWLHGIGDGYRPPLYPVLVALCGGHVSLVRVVQALLLSTVPLAIWRGLARQDARV